MGTRIKKGLKNFEKFVPKIEREESSEERDKRIDRAVDKLFKNHTVITRKEDKMTVEAYTKFHGKYIFKARNIIHAREIASRIVNEHLWVTDDEGSEKGTELFFPVNQVFKVKIVKN